ncbi:hypothetical protein V6N11_080225 [Hibiscus sabdariffa]|uniref:RRM domain-containing protein n=1 Tax=Hibiscus sabdariffa TaxID=183260 RepID=A0ABR1ZR29_9ROSI
MFPSFMLQVKTTIPLFPSIMFQIKTMLPLFSSIMFQVKTMINLFPSIMFQIKTLLRGVERDRCRKSWQLQKATTKHGLSGSNCFSVYVGNLSPKVNWRYLKKLFQRFGSVLDAFIPQKKDLSGSNFGFVRFPTIREAETAVLMFGGAWVVDRRIKVNIAKFNSRTSFWRKKRKDSWTVDHTQNNKNISGDPAANKVEKGECSQAETFEVQLEKGKEKLGKDSGSKDCGETKVSNEMNKTEQVQKICEVVELEVGSMIYEVCVSEIGFSDPSSNYSLFENIERRSKSESSSSSEGNRCNSPIESVDRHAQSGEEELNAAIIGNRRILEKGDSDMGNGRSLGECDLVGVNIEKNVEGPIETTEKNENENLLSFSKSNTNWAELLFKNQLARNENE